MVLSMSDTITTKNPERDDGRIHELLGNIKSIMDDHTFRKGTTLIGYREFGKENTIDYSDKLKYITGKKDDFFLFFVKTVYCDPIFPKNIRITTIYC
jgi:hypothetical protein